MRPPPKNPERALAKILGGYIEAQDAAEIIGEAMADAKTDVVPGEDEALEILEKRAIGIIDEGDNEDVVKILTRLGIAQIDRLALSAELAKAHRSTARAGLRQIAKEIKDGSFFAPPSPPTELRVDLNDQAQVMRAVEKLEEDASSPAVVSSKLLSVPRTAPSSYLRPKD